MLKYILPALFFVSCTSLNMDQEFITEDEAVLEEYAEKALIEAEELLDSLYQTPVLAPGNTEGSQ